MGAGLPLGLMGWLITALALAWSLFQLWIASPLPFMLGFGVLNDTETRAIHLTFALLLAHPRFRRFVLHPGIQCRSATWRWG